MIFIYLLIKYYYLIWKVRRKNKQNQDMKVLKPWISIQFTSVIFNKSFYIK